MAFSQGVRPVASARRMLRAATADLHAAVDAQFSGDFATDRGAYIRFLTALGAVVPPLEAAFEAAGVDQLLPDWPQRRRAPSLRSDLQTMGLPVPIPLPVTPPHSAAKLFGMLYVLEGSRLGGKLLLRRALANSDPQVRSATRYLGHGNARDLWHPFLQCLEASTAVACSPDAAADGAREAFDLFTTGASHG